MDKFRQKWDNFDKNVKKYSRQLRIFVVEFETLSESAIFNIKIKKIVSFFFIYITIAILLYTFSN
jgi:hypothetical protein